MEGRKSKEENMDVKELGICFVVVVGCVVVCMCVCVWHESKESTWVLLLWAVCVRMCMCVILNGGSVGASV